MIFPSAESAVVDLSKLRDYCLDPSHPRGKHKARVFQSSLGLRRGNAGQLRSLILAGIISQTVEAGVSDEYGSRFTCDFEITFNGRSALIRTAWILLHNERDPRLTTCYLF